MEIDMATKTITVTEDAYEAMARRKREGESFSGLFLRLTGRGSNISDFLGAWKMDDRDLTAFEDIRRSWEDGDRMLKRRLRGL
jgi:predicted CopG family antitoxin